ncbi:MAG TPA: SurA N-terminal domain-containing protein [Xanthobacteraceae bacterium]|nr:SurA N-terminal domain-containing protein [Xanthobacteraceae bacterium]
MVLACDRPSQRPPEGNERAMWLTRIGDRARPLATAALVGAVMFAGAPAAWSQQVVALVNGQPITELDIVQRTKLEQMGSPKPPSRQVVLNTIIDEVLEVREAKQYGIDPPQADVDQSYASIADRMGLDAKKLTEVLTKAGSSELALKHRLRAQLAWNALIRGRYRASLEIPDSDVEAALNLHKGDEKKDVGYEYTMRPIIFIVPAGSPAAVFEARKRDADTLRARFANCAEGIPFARALNEVAVRDQITKFSSDLPEQSRAILDGIEVGHLTPPETTAEGVQMFAVCGKRQTKNDTPGKKQIRDEMFEKKFGAKAKRYLAQLRRDAMIEYK